MAEAGDSKLRQMEEEMSRFEAEIAYQTVNNANTTSNTPLTGGFAFPAPTNFLPQLSLGQRIPAALPMAPSIPLYVPLVQPPLQTYQSLTTPLQPLQLSTPVLPNASITHQTSSSNALKPTANKKETEPVVPVQKVITAPPQMAGPNELAARAKEAAAAAAAAKSKAGEDDDDVTRALLAAAAGVTYTRVQGPNGKEKVLASITKPPLTPVITQASAGAQGISQSTDPSTAKITSTLLLPPLAPPAYRSVSTNADYQPLKKKRYIRVAAGVTWEDPTLSEWDPNDFRIFCGDLGNEVSDDTLARAFNRYSSFQRARVVRDKRTGKSRGYGFVSFSDPADFTRAMREMNGKYVGNRPIKLKRSDWRSRQIETHRKKEKEKRKLGLKN
ncbi:unnamed protein product [Calicophoron daubneyi]|uniref:RNA-binding protein 42 n=1 Tax=Calicophoron daubneyi TaxID=300641 RepID=A0AAV2U0M6_CALDB